MSVENAIIAIMAGAVAGMIMAPLGALFGSWLEQKLWDRKLRRLGL